MQVAHELEAVRIIIEDVEADSDVVDHPGGQSDRPGQRSEDVHDVVMRKKKSRPPPPSRTSSLYRVMFSSK